MCIRNGKQTPNISLGHCWIDENENASTTKTNRKYWLMISNHVCIYFTSCVSGRERVGSIVVYSIQVVNSCYSLTQIINHQVKIQIKMKYFSLLLSIYTIRFLLLICSLLKSEKYYSIIMLEYFYQWYFGLSLPFLYKNFIVITDIYVYKIDITSLP